MSTHEAWRDQARDAGRFGHRLHPEADVDLDPTKRSFETRAEAEAHLTDALSAHDIDTESVDLDSVLHELYTESANGFETSASEQVMLTSAEKHRLRTVFRRPQAHAGGKTYTMRRTGTLPADVAETLIRTSRPISQQEMYQLARAAQYAWKAGARGGNVGSPRRVDETSFVMSTDVRQSHSGDSVRALGRFEDQLRVYASEGSPVRKTDRSGPGTKGTRLIEPLPAPPHLQVFYDEVQGQQD